MLGLISKAIIITGAFVLISVPVAETKLKEANVKPKEVVVVNSEQRYYSEWLNCNVSQEDFELLCRTTFCEAGNQDFETQKMVCLTILNRLKSNRFPDTIHDVVYGRNAYEVTTWADFESKEWTEQVEKAVLSALEENSHPGDMFYFRTEHFHTFGESYIKSDDLYFSLEGE